MVWCFEHSEYHHGKKRKAACEYAKKNRIPFPVALSIMGIRSRRKTGRIGK